MNSENCPQLLSTTGLTEADAVEICSWRYTKPYHVYNLPHWQVVRSCGWDISLETKREREYIAFRSNGELIGFGRIFKAGQHVMLGLGIRPDCCGKGLGKMIMGYLTKEAIKRYPDNAPSLEVRTFNERAIKCYIHCGYAVRTAYHRSTLEGDDRFYFMTLKNQRD